MATGGAAKRDVWIFLALLLLFSSVFYAVVFSTSDAPKQWGRYVLPFMWCPGLAAHSDRRDEERHEQHHRPPGNHPPHGMHLAHGTLGGSR